MSQGPIHLELARPLCLLALLLLPVLVYYFVRSLVDFSRWQRLVSLGLRALILVLIVLALAGLTLLKPTQRQYVIFAVDRSLSIGEEGRQAADEFIVEAMRAVGSNEAAVLEFAAKPGILRPPHLPPEGEGQTRTSQDSAGKEHATDIAAAIELAAAAAPPFFVPHVVLLSDGNQTKGDAMSAALNSGLRISTVRLPARQDPEVQVTAVEAPAHVRQGEPFYLEVRIDARQDGEGWVEVFQGAHRLAREQVKLSKGENKLRFRQSIRKERAAEYAVRTSGFSDTLLDNNEARALVFASGKPRVLLVEDEPKAARHLVWALGEEDIEVDVRPPRGMPSSLADLQNYEMLILSNVPATSLTLRQMEVARAYVQDLGGGLMMLGGEQSFGLGGYYKTVIEEILPVRSDFEKEKQKPSLAMVLVIDKSGSMGGMKMELAKDAARSAVELLGPNDRIGVIAFDGEPYVTCEMHSGADKAYVIDRIASISAGGGTNMAPAMEKAYEQLMGVAAKLKHVIVLTDGISSPGDFEGIAGNMAANRMTVSTVGIGQGAHQQLLETIAQVGGGRYYFTDDPSSVPQIFAKETMTASKSAIHEDPFMPQAVRPTAALTGIDLENAPFLLGYVRTRPKPTSEFILASETGDPLLAWWRYGLGMTVAFTSDAKARWGAEWVGWPQFSRFWAQVVRHAMRRSDGQGLLVDVQRRAGKATITVDAVGPDSSYLNGLETKLTIVTPALERKELILRQVAPGQYEGEFDAAERGAYHIEAVQRQHGKVRAQQSRGLVVGYPDELRLMDPDEPLLRAIAESTGGLCNPQPAQVFAPTDRAAQQTIALWPWLTAAALVLFVFDVAVRRIDLGGARPALAARPLVRV